MRRERAPKATRTPLFVFPFFHFEKRQKSLLRDGHLSDLLHAFLSFLLLLQKLSLSGNIPAIALREDVLPQCLDVLSHNDSLADGRLYRNLEKLLRDQFLQLAHDRLPPMECGVSVANEGKRIGGFSADENVDADEVGRADVFGEGRRA